MSLMTLGVEALSRARRARKAESLLHVSDPGLACGGRIVRDLATHVLRRRERKRRGDVAASLEPTTDRVRWSPMHPRSVGNLEARGAEPRWHPSHPLLVPVELGSSRVTSGRLVGRAESVTSRGATFVTTSSSSVLS